MVMLPLALAAVGATANYIGGRRAKKKQRRRLADYARQRGDLMRQLEDQAWQGEQERQGVTASTLEGLSSATQPAREAVRLSADDAGGVSDDGSLGAAARRAVVERDLGLANSGLAADNAEANAGRMGRQLAGNRFSASVPAMTRSAEISRRRYLLARQLAELDNSFGMTANDIPNDALAWQLAGGLANAGSRIGFQSAARA